MSSVARRFTAAALVASAIAVACKDAQVRTSSDRRDHSDATFAKRDTNRALGPGDPGLGRRGVTTGLGVGVDDGRELDGDPACITDAVADALGELEMVAVARIDIAARLRDADDRLS